MMFCEDEIAFPWFIATCFAGVSAIPFLQITFLYDVILNTEQMWYMIFCRIFGVACIVFPFLMPHIVAFKTYRKSDKVNPTEMTFGEEDIYVKNSKEGITTEHHFAYSVTDKIIEKSGVVYLRIAIEKSKVYLALHDESYLEGSREELLALLKRKEIEEV